MAAAVGRMHNARDCGFCWGFYFDSDCSEDYPTSLQQPIALSMTISARNRKSDVFAYLAYFASMTMHLGYFADGEVDGNGPAAAIYYLLGISRRSTDAQSYVSHCSGDDASGWSGPLRPCAGPGVRSGSVSHVPE